MWIICESNFWKKCEYKPCQIFRIFSDFFQKFLSEFFLKKIWKNLKNFWKFSEKCLKFFKIGENQRKSLKVAAKQFVFLHFWYLGTAKSKETTSWKPRKQQQTASFPTFFIGWQQKISRFRNFQKFLKKIWKISEKFLKNFWKNLKNFKKNLKNVAMLLVPDFYQKPWVPLVKFQKFYPEIFQKYFRN